MTNGGVAGAEAGVEEAAKAIGWTVKVLDGQGTQQGMDQAMNQAVTLHADGIVVGGFDPPSAIFQPICLFGRILDSMLKQ